MAIVVCGSLIVPRDPPPIDVRGEICAWGKGQNIAVQSRKNFARMQEILLAVSKYPRLHSSLPSRCVGSQVEEAIACCAWLERG